jgi:hypothetical protein
LDDETLEQPSYVTAARLEPHQLAGAAMLRRLYLQGHHAVIADDPALGIAATVLTFMQARRLCCDALLSPASSPCSGHRALDVIL